MAGNGGKIVDVVGGMRSKRTLTKTGFSGHKAYVQIGLPDLKLDLREREIGGQVAEGLVALIQTAMAEGRIGPPPAPSTLWRRRYRREQAGRSGELTSRIKNPRDRRQGAKNFKVRFRTVKGASYSPLSPPVENRRGIESGLLVGQLAAAFEAGVWRIYTANNRGIKDRSGKAALDRVFGGTLTAALRGIIASASGQDLMKAVEQAIVIQNGRRAVRALMKLIRQAQGLGSQLQGLADKGQDDNG